MLSIAPLNIVGTSNGARIRPVQLNRIGAFPKGVCSQIWLQSAGDMIARTSDSLLRHNRDGLVLALCVAARLTGVLLQLGGKLLCRRLWAHQPLTRGPERPIVLIVAHRRNGWEAAIRSGEING